MVADRAANRGYAAEGSEALAYSIGETDLAPDLFEAFNIGRELTAEQAAEPYFATFRERYFAANLWPDQPAGIRTTWLAYWDAVEAPGHADHVRPRRWRSTSRRPLRRRRSTARSA